MTANRHPAAADLDAFALGLLPDDDCAAVEGHLAACDDCRRLVGTAPPDTFVSLLTAAAPRLAADDAGRATDAPTQTWGEPAPPVTAPPAALADHPHYRLLRPLGGGGMGAVWLAEHAVMNRLVALKVIRPDQLARPEAVERFLREVRTLARLAHPNVVAAYDAGQVGDTHYLVMEYVEGQSLDDAGPLPVAEACRAARDAARGLAAAHAAGLVHRDVKPANLIRTADGTVKVLDFGLAIAGDAEGGLTGPRVVVGTPDFIAPEQAEDARAADARSDVYSLGCTLYALLAGRVPYPVDGTLKKLDAHRAGRPPALRDVPPGLAAVVARMMARRPADRYAGAAAAAEALEPFCNGLPPPQSGRRGFVLGLAALAAAVAAGVVLRVQTDRGELVIETDGDDVEVAIRQGGREVGLIDTKTGHRLTLRSGTYELELNGKPSGLALDIDRAALTRGGAVVARVERVPKPAAAAELFYRPPDYDGQVCWLNLAPDGETLLVGRSKPNSYNLIAYCVADGRRRFTAEATCFGNFLAGGREIVAAMYDRLEILDGATGRVVREFNDSCPHIWNLQTASDGRTCLTHSKDRLVRLWDVPGGKLLQQWDVAWAYHTADGRAVIRGSAADGAVTAFDLDAGRDVPLPEVYRTAAGQWEALCKAGGAAKAPWTGQPFYAYDRATGATVWPLQASTPGGMLCTWALTIDRRGRFFVHPSEGGCAVRRLPDGAALARLKLEMTAAVITVSSDGRRVAASTDASEVAVWQLAPP